MAAQLHFTKNAFALHLLLQRFERLVNIVVTNENLHGAVNSFWVRFISVTRDMAFQLRVVALPYSFWVMQFLPCGLCGFLSPRNL
ncbi:hypothetical protein GMO_13870 [Gluconobacter morbifer G707]|uniref:Uncharacterized protein n=1 Tax=Gluconobacter morbifer G707 TaxID=1088869 RepID=G6XIH7_9PROT|nr:hypothetical protein GMO_13870 [Gluconobacter morbifer G707]